MEQSPSWEADSNSPHEESRRLLLNPKVHYLIHKSYPLVSVPCQMNLLYNLPTYFFQIHSNIILPSMLSSSSGLLFQVFFDQNFV
jgi:hypothetical protein